jgi:hypothetical protein
MQRAPFFDTMPKKNATTEELGYVRIARVLFRRLDPIDRQSVCRRRARGLARGMGGWR